MVGLLFGLTVSAFVNSSEKAMALVPVIFVVFWLFSGVAASLADKPILHEVAYLAPPNWGLAAAASSANLRSLEGCDVVQSPRRPTSGGPARVCDARWQTGPLTWALDMAALMLLGGAAYVIADWALARKEPLVALRRDNIARHLVERARRLTHKLFPER